MKKLMQRLTTGLLILLLVISVPLSVLAADTEYDTLEDVHNWLETHHKKPQYDDT